MRQMSWRLVRLQLVALGVGLGGGGCAAAMNVTPLPCSGALPDTRTAPNETSPRMRSIHLFNSRSDADIYFLVEPSGTVNPDSIMVCGIENPDVRTKAAEAIAKSTLDPATVNGTPVRKWFLLHYKSD